jgi:hypothetical protein
VKIYHGSTNCVSEPRLLAATRRLDFGPGFYATSDLKQAKQWALIKQRRLMAPHAIVSFSRHNRRLAYYVTTLARRSPNDCSTIPPHF